MDFQDKKSRDSEIAPTEKGEKNNGNSEIRD